MNTKLKIGLNILFIGAVGFELCTDFNIQDLIMDVAYIGSLFIKGE